MPLSTTLGDLTPVDWGQLNSHVHNAPHIHTKYYINKSLKDKHGGASHLRGWWKRIAASLRSALGTLWDVSHKTEYNDCQSLSAVAIEEFWRSNTQHFCYQCFIVQNKIEILWHIKQLFLQKESLQILIIYTNNSFSKNKILI